jgi:hypothetical protein
VGGHRHFRQEFLGFPECAESVDYFMSTAEIQDIVANKVFWHSPIMPIVCKDDTI